MKKISLSLFFLSAALALPAQQEFAPIGAVWHFQRYEFFHSPWTPIRFYRIESVGDTLIQGRLCRKLHTNEPITCTWRREVEFVHQQGDTVWLYDQDRETFEVLYNFGAQPGDSWTMELVQEMSNMPITLTVGVDSIASITINGVSLRQLFASYTLHTPEYTSDCFPFNGAFTELLGAENYLYYFWQFEIGPICDTPYPGGLRCYYDPNIGAFNTGLAPGCEWIGVSVRDLSDTPEHIRVFPNPTADVLTIENLRAGPLDFSVWDVHGRIVLRGQSTPGHTEVATGHWPGGVYVIRFEERGKGVGRLRVVRK